MKWFLNSNSDSRWNTQGEAKEHTDPVQMPKECRLKIQELHEKYGPIPMDLEWGAADG